MNIYYNPIFLLIPIIIIIGVVVAVQLGRKIANWLGWWDEIGIVLLLLVCEVVILAGFFVHPA